MKTYWESGGIASRIHNIGISWRGLVSFMFRPLYSQSRNPPPPVPFWIGCWTRWRREENPCWESNLGLAVRGLVTILSELGLPRRILLGVDLRELYKVDCTGSGWHPLAAVIEELRSYRSHRELCNVTWYHEDVGFVTFLTVSGIVTNRDTCLLKWGLSWLL
jgi:hypothetical protein